MVKQRSCKQGRERLQPMVSLERNLGMRLQNLNFLEWMSFPLGFPAGTNQSHIALATTRLWLSKEVKGVVPHSQLHPRAKLTFSQSSGACAVGSFQTIKGVTQKIRCSRWGYFLAYISLCHSFSSHSDKPSGFTIVDIAIRGCWGAGAKGPLPSSSLLDRSDTWTWRQFVT